MNVAASAKATSRADDETAFCRKERHGAQGADDEAGCQQHLAAPVGGELPCERHDGGDGSQPEAQLPDLEGRSCEGYVAHDGRGRHAYQEQPCPVEAEPEEPGREQVLRFHGIYPLVADPSDETRRCRLSPVGVTYQYRWHTRRA